jgi:hypothetical protein
MKIGILSMQKVKNYGSFFQAFALKKTLENEDCDCYFIDIEKGEQLRGIEITVFFYIRKLFEKFFSFTALPRIYYWVKFVKVFPKYQKPLELEKKISQLENYDLVVIGSDEVFNCTQKSALGFSQQLFGANIKSSIIISYAASFGHTTKEDIITYNLFDKIKLGLTNLKAISVRDNNSFQLIEYITNEKPNINVDPVLIYDFDSYIPKTNQFGLKDYIIIYSYPNRIKNKEEISEIKTFASKVNKQLVSIGFYFSWCDKTIIPEPFEVMRLFKDASYIITDTFHGAVMSIKFNKKFVVLVRKSNEQKLTYLLNQFKLTSQIIKRGEKLEDKLIQDIDYVNVNSIISGEKINSINYLKDCLNFARTSMY